MGNRTSTPRKKPDCSREAASGRKPVQRDHRTCRRTRGRPKARKLKAALEHRIGAIVPPDARTLSWLVEFAAYRMNRSDTGRDGKTPLQRLHMKRQHTCSGIWREGSVHAGQASKREKVGTAIPSPSFCGDAELIIRGCGRHRAKNGDQDTLGELWENPRVGEMGRGQNTWNTSCSTVSGWQ